ncbi:MAG: hypothetical protein QM796_20675 [Chthoniobacteraceae bacterium]
MASSDFDQNMPKQNLFPELSKDWHWWHNISQTADAHLDFARWWSSGIKAEVIHSAWFYELDARIQYAPTGWESHFAT